MSSLNLVPASLGRFMTRSNRLVEIYGSEEIMGPKRGGPGVEKRTVFNGHLFKQDGKTIDSKHKWEKSGQFVNQSGVYNQHDLCQALSRVPDAAPVGTALESAEEGEAVDVLLSGATSGEYTALVELLNEHAIEGDETPLGTLNRILAELQRSRENPAHKAATKKKAAKRK